MAGLFDFMKYDKDEPAPRSTQQTALELRRIANLFLLSERHARAVRAARASPRRSSVTFIPQAVYVVWGLVLLTGWAATEVYGVYVTFTARRWGWFVLCLIPVTCVPAAVAYAWIRRQEIERAFLGDQRAPAARQRRGGKKKR